MQDEVRCEADRIEEDCTYSAKGHYESARMWGLWNMRLGLPAAILAAFAGVSGFSEMPLLSGALAVFSGSLTAVLTFLKPAERASRHQRAGTQYNSLMNKARVFRNIEGAAAVKPGAAIRRLNKLSDARNSLNEASPEILRPAFERARKGIQEGEAAYRAGGGTR